MTRLRFWIPVALLLASFWPPRSGLGQQLALEDFEGDYIHVGGQRDERRIEAAIDGVVDQMNIFTREIARGEIRGHVRPERRVRIDVASGDRVRFTLDGWGPNTVSLDGDERRVRGPDGSATRLSGGFGGGRLYMRQASRRGERHSWLTLAPDRQRLNMRIRITAGQLPDDIDYALTYRRR